MIKVFIKPWGDTVWQDWTDNLSGTIPDVQDKDVSSLVVFSLEFQDLDDSLINFETGWDLAVCEYDDDDNLIEICGNGKMFGKINSIEIIEAYGYSDYDEDGLAFPKFKFRIGVEQRDFSTIPFTLDYEGVKSANAIVTKIFEQYVRKELGGVLPSGTVVDRFELTCDDYDLLNFKNKGTSRRQLNEICSRASWAWELIGIPEENETTLISVLYKVRIWEE